jgi:hypothetical protein
LSQGRKLQPDPWCERVLARGKAQNDQFFEELRKAAEKADLPNQGRILPSL